MDHSEMQAHPPQAGVVEGPMEEDKLMLLHMFLKKPKKSGSLYNMISLSWNRIPI
jgi:hypothetical protein